MGIDIDQMQRPPLCLSVHSLSREHKISAKQRIDKVRLLANGLDFTEASEDDDQARNMVLVRLERERPSSNLSPDTTVSE